MPQRPYKQEAKIHALYLSCPLPLSLMILHLSWTNLLCKPKDTHCWALRNQIQTLQGTHLMSLSGALWHPHIGHLWPNPECPGALRMKQLSLNSKCMCFHGIAGKGFMSLKAGTRQPLSSED